MPTLWRVFNFCFRKLRIFDFLCLCHIVYIFTGFPRELIRCYADPYRQTSTASTTIWYCSMLVIFAFLRKTPKNRSEYVFLVSSGKNPILTLNLEFAKKNANFSIFVKFASFIPFALVSVGRWWDHDPALWRATHVPPRAGYNARSAWKIPK